MRPSLKPKGLSESIHGDADVAFRPVRNLENHHVRESPSPRPRMTCKLQTLQPGGKITPRDLPRSARKTLQNNGIGALQDRTHRGGAVLWFLRRHAPMPSSTPWSDTADFSISDKSTASTTLPADSEGPALSDDEEEWSWSMDSSKFGKSRSNRSTINRQSRKLGKSEFNGLDSSPPSFMDASGASTDTKSSYPQKSRKHKPVPPKAPPQQQFLHQTLLAIGNEVDESSRVATQQRDHLRQGFAAHTDAECESLKAKVKEREAEVDRLSARVVQLRHLLETTRAASLHRQCRHNVQSEAKEQAVDQREAVHKTKRHFLDSDSIHEAKQAKADTMEEWQAKVHAQRELEADLEWDYTESSQKLMNMLVNRKVTEATLLGAHAQTLQLRTKAIREEQRAVQLANELKRVVQSLPRIVEQQLSNLSEARDGQRKQEMANISQRFQEESFKYMDSDSLKKETQVWMERLKQMKVSCEEASRSLIICTSHAAELLHHADLMEGSLKDLSSSWSLMTHDLSMRAFSSKGYGMAWDDYEDAQVLMNRTLVTAQLIKETLISLQKPSKSIQLDA